ncbi:MAG: MATE family efflux transporter [Candidatus Goldbacteria bacterium]|nr:MATE family efflux transporter [Candidatus Goldiibacteriota bacterium]
MKNLTEGNVLKNLFIYSWPIMAGDLLQSLYSAIDAFWVGRLLGPDALAAVSSSMPVMFFLISLIIGLSVSTVIMIGQAYGMDDMEFVSKIMSNSFITIFSLCLFITVLGTALAMPMLKFLGTPAAIIKDAHTFLIIIFSGLIFMFTQNWFAGILRGLGDSKTPLIFSCIYVALNIILAPLLIKGWWIFPELKIAGSAAATVISGAATTLISFFYLARKNVIFNILKWKFQLNYSIIKKMFTIGIPVTFQMVIVSVSAIAVISFVNRFGPGIIAAYGIGLRIDQFSFIPAMSLGAAASSFTAQAIGAKKEELIREVALWVTILSLAFAAAAFAVINLFPHQITAVFTVDAAVISHGAVYFKYITLTYFAYAVMFAFQGIVRGSGDTLPSTLFAFITLIALRVGLSWVLLDKAGMDERGVWIGITASAYLGALLNYWYYKSGRWKNREKLKPYSREI